ncbi:MAG: hypothetical protein R3A12_03505 [Ignavibacteria bacterium]
MSQSVTSPNLTTPATVGLKKYLSPACAQDQKPFCFDELGFEAYTPNTTPANGTNFPSLI